MHSVRKVWKQDVLSEKEKKIGSLAVVCIYSGYSVGKNDSLATRWLVVDHTITVHCFIERLRCEVTGGYKLVSCVLYGLSPWRRELPTPI